MGICESLSKSSRTVWINGHPNLAIDILVTRHFKLEFPSLTCVFRSRPKCGRLPVERFSKYETDDLDWMVPLGMAGISDVAPGEIVSLRVWSNASSFPVRFRTYGILTYCEMREFLTPYLEIECRFEPCSKC
jgi:hypothetical protein